MNFNLHDLVLLAPEDFLLGATCAILFIDLFLKQSRRVVTHWLSIAALLGTIAIILADHEPAAMAFNGAYIRRVAAANPGKKIYLASTVGQGLLLVLQKELYLTGLAFRYSATPIDNLTFLRDNVGMKMNLETVGLATLSNNAFDNSSSQQLQMNYVLPLVLAAQQYESGGDKDKAEMLRAKARQVGANAGRRKEVETLIGQ